MLRVQGRAFELAPERALSRKDGLLFFRDGDESKPVAFAADKLTALNGDEIGVAHPGRPVWVHTNAEALPDPGQELRHISSRLQDLKSVSPEIWPLFAGRLAAVCRCGADGLCEIAADCHGFRVGAEMRLSISRARNRRDFNEVLSKMFAESDKSLWRATEIRLENATGLAADEIFVPPSELKKLKNSFYAALDAMAAELPARLLARLDAMPWPEPLPGTVCGSLPPRRQLGPEAGASHPIPFIVSPDEVRRLTAAAGKTPDGPLFLPLGPLSFASGELFQAVEDAVRGAAGRRVLVGINNVSHLELARRLRDLPRVSFFADFLFYVANRQTLRFLAGTVPGLAFAYSWIEGGQEVAETLRRKLPAGQAVLIRQIEPEFKPPLFISLACFWKHNGLGKPCRECGGEPPPARLKNGGQHFLARSAGCVTYFFAEDRQALAESASPTAVKYSNID